MKTRGIYHCITLAVLVCSMFASVRSAGHCRYVYDNSFEGCDNRVLSTEFTNRVDSTTSNVTRATCTRENVNVCSKIFNVTRVVGQKMSVRALNKISDMLRQCCGECGVFTMSDLTTELPHLDFEDVADADILFPVLGRASLKELYDLHYVPIFELPGAYYLQLEKTDEEMATLIINGEWSSLCKNVRVRAFFFNFWNDGFFAPLILHPNYFYRDPLFLLYYNYTPPQSSFYN